ncbi:Fe-S cluster assembly protein SufD [Terrilactibacillus sp. BCM23-1]|uniref:Fe-S cluster assembly protein SufD n=1 Tax=Terrilactibacillus tamarindi TaxID=2599694 RepID=A0A6N8CRS9_9BACI|nr:Fe-S cluster assembly protein SufD [Terrilactibacillus tamarindi]MTT30686.1 Fe-S cluster assembly protein SufD [Terrilactibacillus tamarindi]
MSTELKTLQYNANDIESFSKEQNEPQWLTDVRMRAYELVQTLPLPKTEKTRIIGWNFTDFNYKTQGREVTNLNDLPSEAAKVVGAEDQYAAILVQHNGHKAYHSVSKELQDKGVIITDLQTAIREHGDLVQKYYFKAGKVDKHRLSALNAALLNSGTFIYIPKNVVIEKPLQTVYFQDAENFGLINHSILVADQGSALTYVENYVSDHETIEGVANLLTEVYVEDNAQVKFGAVDYFSKDVTVYVNRQGRVGRYGQLEWAFGQMNDGNTVSENVTELIGEGAVSHTKAVSIGRGDQKQSFDNYIVHIGTNTESNILIHGVQKDQAKAIFNGRTKIEHGASKSNGDQTQRVLMLSEGARGDANPILLIDEDDVMAGHAASVGRIDPVQLYYLMSRGISRTEAERLIIHGFLEPVVEQLQIESVKAQLTAAIERKVR